MEEKEKLSEEKAKHKLPQSHLVLMHGSMIKGKQALLRNEIIGGFQFGAGSSYLTEACSS